MSSHFFLVSMTIYVGMRQYIAEEYLKATTLTRRNPVLIID